MTYCIGIRVAEGLAILADTRTNAGVDNVSTYRKLRLIENSGDRLIALAAAGSLSTTQAALERLRQGLIDPESGAVETLAEAPNIYAAAALVGRALRQSRAAMAGLKAEDVNFDATFLVGGTIGGEPMRLFLVYAAGNAIECGAETPYLQIGENKYGKPILDRALVYETPLMEAIKIALISFDSTMRSNLAVGLPIDLVIAPAAAPLPATSRRIDAEDPYFHDLSDRWATALAHARAEIPNPPY